MLPGITEELNKLNSFYNNDTSNLIVFYGPKGVGLLSLIKEFTKDKKAYIHKVANTSLRNICYLWNKQLVSQGICLDNEYPDFSDIFDAILESLKGDKIVIVIEDFHNILKVCPDFVNQLGIFVREYQLDNRLLVILSTDHISWIENQFVSIIGKSAYSIDGFLKVNPLSFLDLACFYNTDIEKCIEYYCILGGLQDYWIYFKPELSLKDNIINAFLKDDAPLKNVGEDIILNEMRELNVYSTVLAGLAEGKEKLNDLHNHTEFGRAKLSVYLKNLDAIDVIKKVYSYDTAGFVNTKKGIYRINNSLVAFWYKFIYPNLSMLDTLDPDEFYDKFIKDGLRDFTNRYFSNVCREYMLLMSEKGALEIEATRYGTWVGKNGTIDIILEDDNRKTVVGFCHTGPDAMNLMDLEWLIFCIDKAYLDPEMIYIYSLYGFDNKLKMNAADSDQIKLIELSDF